MITTTLPILRLASFDLRDQASLAIVDLSTYSTVLTSSDVSLQITPPGYNTINVAFNPGSVNVYKCADLGITCSSTECCPLPDGIYDIIYSIIGNTSATIEKTIIKIDQIKCKFQHAFLKIKMDCNCGKEEMREYRKELDIIDLLIAGSVAAANDCNPQQSFNLYQKAEILLNSLGCTVGCGCGSSFVCPSCQ